MAHVFVVDDDDQLLRMVGLMLERGGHSATLVSNPLEALEMIHEEVPDLAILDVMMPGMDGFELCQELRGSDDTEALPIIMLTARGPRATGDRALEAGADEYLTKPITSQELLTHVDQLLKRKDTGDVAESEPINSQIISFFSLSGGVGKTTCAINLASELAKDESVPVCLVDFTAVCGQVAMHFRLQPDASWGNIPDQGNLTWADVADEIVTLPTGLSIMPAPLIPVLPEQPSLGMARRILALLQDRYAFILIDLPAYLSSTVTGLLKMSDTVFHVINPDVVSVQTAVRAERSLNFKDSFQAKRLFVLNHTTSTPQLSIETVARGMNAEIPVEIEFDANQTRALAQGVPLALSGSSSTIPLGIETMSKLVATRELS